MFKSAGRIRLKKHDETVQLHDETLKNTRFVIMKQ